MRDERQAVSAPDLRGRAILVAVLVLAAIACAYLVGAWRERATRAPAQGNAATSLDGAGVSELYCLVPMNFLTGQPWKIGASSREESNALLGGEISLAEGQYDLRGISHAIARATGKAVVWVPEYDARYAHGGMPGFRVVPRITEIIERGHGIEIPVRCKLCDVLNWICAVATEVGVEGSRSSEPIEDTEEAARMRQHGIWVAIVLSDAIVFVRVPVQSLGS